MILILIVSEINQPPNAEASPVAKLGDEMSQDYYIALMNKFSAAISFLVTLLALHLSSAGASGAAVGPIEYAHADD